MISPEDYCEGIDYKDVGEVRLDACDDANIPVCVFCGTACEDDGKEIEGLYSITANNYTPRKDHIYQNVYNVISPKKEVLLWLINKYIVPLYVNALANITRGNLYYWRKPSDMPIKINSDVDRHICLPKYTPIFTVDQWQCGCGKYFCKKGDAITQMEKYKAQLLEAEKLT